MIGHRCWIARCYHKMIAEGRDKKTFPPRLNQERDRYEKHCFVERRETSSELRRPLYNPSRPAGSWS